MFGVNAVVGAVQQVIGFIVRVIQMALFFISLFLGAVWYLQESILFHPELPKGMKTPSMNPPGYRRPDEAADLGPPIANMPYDDVYTRTSDGVRINMWLIRQRYGDWKTRPTIIFFQGNAGNMGLRMPNFWRMYDYLRCNLLTLSYRGYGHSEGHPTEVGVYRDGEAALQWLLDASDVDKTKIFLFGRSLGGAIALDLAMKYPQHVRGVVVENTFTSLSDMVEVLFPFLLPLKWLVTKLQRLHMDTIHRVPHVVAPTLFIAGQADMLVPPAHMERLYAASGSRHKKICRIANGTHNETWTDPHEYFQAFRAFIHEAEAIPLPEAPPPKAPATPLNGGKGDDRAATDVSTSASSRCTAADDSNHNNSHMNMPMHSGGAVVVGEMNGPTGHDKNKVV